MHLAGAVVGFVRSIHEIMAACSVRMHFNQTRAEKGPPSVNRSHAFRHEFRRDLPNDLSVFYQEAALLYASVYDPDISDQCRRHFSSSVQDTFLPM